MKMHSVLFILAAFIIMPACKKSKTTPASTLNPWDGRYRMEGTMTDHTNPAFGWMNNTYEYSLHTSGPNTDSLVSKTLNFPGIVIGNTGGVPPITNATFYSNFGLIMTFDAATNKVTAVTNYYGQGAGPSGRSAVLDPSGFNDVDPATKNIRVKFFMDETAVVGHRATFNVTLVYLGPR